MPTAAITITNDYLNERDFTPTPATLPHWRKLTDASDATWLQVSTAGFTEAGMGFTLIYSGGTSVVTVNLENAGEKDNAEIDFPVNLTPSQWAIASVRMEPVEGQGEEGPRITT